MNLGVSVQMCVGVSVKVCGCVCAGVDACTGVWVCLHMCIVWGDSNHIYHYILCCVQLTWCVM